MSAASTALAPGVAQLVRLLLKRTCLGPQTARCALADTTAPRVHGASACMLRKRVEEALWVMPYAEGSTKVSTYSLCTTRRRLYVAAGACAGSNYAIGASWLVATGAPLELPCVTHSHESANRQCDSHKEPVPSVLACAYASMSGFFRTTIGRAISYLKDVRTAVWHRDAPLLHLVVAPASRYLVYAAPPAALAALFYATSADAMFVRMLADRDARARLQRGERQQS